MPRPVTPRRLCGHPPQGGRCLAAVSGALGGAGGALGAPRCCVFQDDCPEKADGDAVDAVPEAQETVQVIPGSKLLWRVNTRPPNSAQVRAPRPSQAPQPSTVTRGTPCPPSPDPDTSALCAHITVPGLHCKPSEPIPAASYQKGFQTRFERLFF